MTVKSNKSAKVNNSDGQTIAEKEKHDGSRNEPNQAEEKKPQSVKHQYPNLLGYLDEHAHRSASASLGDQQRQASSSPLREALGKLQSEEESVSARGQAERLLIDALKRSFTSAIRLRREAMAKANGVELVQSQRLTTMEQ